MASYSERAPVRSLSRSGTGTCFAAEVRRHRSPDDIASGGNHTFQVEVAGQGQTVVVYLPKLPNSWLEVAVHAYVVEWRFLELANC